MLAVRPIPEPSTEVLPDTAVLPHSQLTAWVFPGKTYVPGTARREVYPGEQSPSLWRRRGRGHPLWGLCLCGWEAKLEMGTKKGTPTSIASALCTRYLQPSQQDTEVADIVGDRQYGGVLSTGTLVGAKVAVTPMVLCFS